MTETLYKPPSVPDKMEVIPIHTSDRAQFKFCRRKWNWSSPMRDNLRGKVTQTGIAFPLWFGTGVHRALAAMYNPVLSHDPVEAFSTWYQTCWEGGIVATEDLDDVCYDPNPYELENDTWRILGLRDLIPDIYSHEEFEEHRELGINMMKFYRDEFAPNTDNFRVIVQEHLYSVPLGFDAIDPRDGEKKEVHYRGRQDAIIQDIETERYGILEHKTAAKVDEDYFRKLEKDEQVTSYMWAAEREAEIFDLPYKQIDFTLYNVLRKTYPKPPTQLKSGLFSIDRSKESTTPEMLAQFISDAGISVVVEADEKLSNYVEYVNEAGYDPFVQRKFITRNRSEVKSCEWRVVSEAEDMLGIPLGMNRKLYPNPTGDRYCLSCPFRAPCIAYDDGSDFSSMLEDNYEKNVGR